MVQTVPKQFWWIQYEDVVESNDSPKTLVTNSADIQYAKWQHGPGLEKTIYILQCGDDWG